MFDLYCCPEWRLGPGRLEMTKGARTLRGVELRLAAPFLLNLVVAGSLVGQDPANVVGAAECLECHEAAHGVWEETPHQSAFQTLHRLDASQAVLESMGERSARRGICVNCHYTAQATGSRSARAISGVSCESCHGAAAEWLDVHNNYGLDAAGGQATRETETAEHSATRLRQSEEMGMIRPDQPYRLVQNCFQCHTVPGEDLVNTGGHASGSDFDLVSRLETIRHNFQASNDQVNREAARDFDPAARKQLFEALGPMVDLEYALRGLAEATAAGTYAQAMTDRANSAMERLRALATQPAIEQVLEAAGGVNLAPNANAELIGAADRIRATTMAFAAQHP